MSLKEIDQFRATFRQSARDAKGLLKRSSEYATLEKALRDTEFNITDNLQSLGIEKAGEFKSLNNYVKDMINTSEFLNKTLRGQTVKGGRAWNNCGQSCWRYCRFTRWNFNCYSWLGGGRIYR